MRSVYFAIFSRLSGPWVTSSRHAPAADVPAGRVPSVGTGEGLFSLSDGLHCFARRGTSLILPGTSIARSPDTEVSRLNTAHGCPLLLAGVTSAETPLVRCELKMQHPDQRLRSVGGVFVAGLAFVAAACSAQSPPSDSSQPAPATGDASTFVSAVTDGFFSSTDSLMARLGFGPPDDVFEKAQKGAVAQGEGDEEEAPADPQRVARSTPRPRATPPVELAAPEPEPAAATPSLMAVESPVANAPAVDEPPREYDTTIYTVADLDVIPPVMRSADLPRWRPSDGDDADSVEVLVSPDGGVDRIKLVSQPRRMVDVMTLSAAKMWQFEPALKDGEPVRYRLILQTPRPSSQR